LQLSDLNHNLGKLGLRLKISKNAKKLIVKKGYDPEFGVRHLRREIQRSLEDPISEMLLKQVFKKGTIIKVDSIKKQLKFDYQQKQYSKRKPTKLSPD
ncbi:MAG: ATP-dependent Clp protease ATP-binding subunit, partial [Candidatus Neomarinimicrobiota bacterium]|nr:ATP-dependent Clp protease ATP-binding subunit [Candidatus Neomarinimicrobiota bacterium]